MEWNEFVTKVAEDLPALMEEKGYDIQTKRQRVEKLQADTYDAVAVTFGNQNIGMLYRLEEDYAAYQRGIGYGDILDDICDAVIKHWDERVAEMEIPKVLDYGWAKPRLILQLVETERNKDYLKRCPHQEFHEFSMVCRVEAMVDDGCSGVVLVDNPLLERYGISKEQLFQDAMEQNAKRYPIVVQDMVDILEELMDDLSDLPDNRGMQFVATMPGHPFGASVMVQPGFLDRAARALGESFYIIPSSIEEIILLPESQGVNMPDLDQIVQCINREQLSPEQVLSDHVYHYDAAARLFERREVYEMRRMVEELVGGSRSSVMVALQAAKEDVERTPVKPSKGRSEPSR